MHPAVNRGGVDEQQMRLDFDDSVSVRSRRARKSLEASEQPTLFAAWAPNIDVHLHSATEAVASIAGGEPDRTTLWLSGLVGTVRPLKSRRVAFNVTALDRLAYLRPPAHVTLDAAALAVARALWAHSLGLRPLVVSRIGSRLVASSSRWPTGLGVSDAPWPAIAALAAAGVPFEVQPRARKLFAGKLVSSGQYIAKAGLAGSAVLLEASRPDVLESMNLPGLAYAGEARTGRYKLPLLAAAQLLNEPGVQMSPELIAAVKRATAPVRKLTPPADFPWKLYGFQASDAGRGLRIVQTTGGVLLAGDMGSGKGLALDTEMRTPTGRKTAGQVQVGDLLVGSSGAATRVTGVFPQPAQQLWAVRFSDGSQLVTDDAHRWAMHAPARARNGTAPLILTTQELRQGSLVDAHGAPRWHIPTLTSPAVLDSGAQRPVGGYLLGLLLGAGRLDGGLRLRAAPGPVRDQLCHVFGSPADRTGAVALEWDARRSETLREALAALGLREQSAPEMFVPVAYKYAPEPVRRAVLQGVLDTVGTVWPAAGSWFTSVTFEVRSRRLAQDVVWLVESFGGTARALRPSKPGQPEIWRYRIALPPAVRPFRLQGNAGRYAAQAAHPPRRTIESIEDAGTGPTVCFSVDAPDKLFCAGPMVISHNTTMSLAIAANMELWPLLVVAPLSAFATWQKQLGEMGKRTYLATEAPALAWQQIETGQYEAVVVSYDRLPAFVELIERSGFAGIIADEIQRIRNPGSRRSRALRSISGAVPYRMGLSGTPLVNTVGDLLAQGAFLIPGEWPPRASMKTLEDLYPGDPVESIAEHLGSMMVRRRMEDTGAKLPKRNDHRVYVELTVEQRSALAVLEAEAQAAKDAGEFDGPNGKFNALVKLTKMRQIVSSPKAAGIGGINPKVNSALKLAAGYVTEGRRGVIFCVDRATFRELGAGLDALGIRWGGIWGATPTAERIDIERRLQAHELEIVIGTLAAASESWSASPAGTFCIMAGMSYSAATHNQAECRVYRLSSDLHGPEIEIVYVHATMPGGSTDDRVVEILAVKKMLQAQVVDRAVFTDNTSVHLSLSDLLFVLTGQRDEMTVAAEKDAKAVVEREQAAKLHARSSIYGRKGRNRSAVETFRDDGAHADVLEVAGGSADATDELLRVGVRDQSWARPVERDADMDGLLAEIDLDDEGEDHDGLGEELFDVDADDLD